MQIAINILYKPIAIREGKFYTWVMAKIMKLSYFIRSEIFRGGVALPGSKME